MDTVVSQVPRVVELAERIVEDIARRELKPGDVYQRTAETADMLGVSTTMANQAMRMLVKRGVLDRRQGKGTFIAVPQEGRREKVGLRSVHLLVQEDFLKMEGLMADGVVVGLNEVLPGTRVGFNFLPAEGEAGYVSELIAQAMRSAEPEGFVLVRGSLQAQRLVAGSGLPAVVHGQLHPSVPKMASIDRDHRKTGRMVVDYLVKRGFRNVLVMFRDRLLTGDHQMLDGVRDRVEELGLGAGALTARALPADHEAIAAEVGMVLQDRQAGVNGVGRGGMGIVCRSPVLAKGALAAAEKLGLRKRVGFEIVMSDVYRGRDAGQGRGESRWPYLKPRLTPEQVGARIGEMLLAQARNEMVAPVEERIEVTLEESSEVER